MATAALPISALPADKQIIEHDGKRYTTVKEGLAHILVPAPVEASQVSNDSGQVQQVFYNPIQQFNRDLTVLAITAFGRTRIEEKQVLMQSRRERNKRKRENKRNHDGEDRPAKLLKLSEDQAAPNHDPTTSTTGAEEIMTAAEKDVEQPDQSSQSSAPAFTILDALSASGLRALRYAHEIPFVTSVTANDLGTSAVESIKLNVEHNRLESKINISHDDAMAHMYGVVVNELRRINMHGKQRSEKYDVVDIDPYGSAAPFFDAAVQSVRDDGGLLCVTCTDAGVWASNGYPEKCYALYGGIPVKGWHSHEAGLRIVLHGIETSAARYGLAIEPLLSLSIDFYLRVFVRIKRSPSQVKFQGGKTMLVYTCDSGCGAWETQPLMRNKPVPNKNGATFYKHTMAAAPTTSQTCPHCHSTMHLSGPMYAGRIHSNSFINSILAEVPDVSTDTYGTTDRIRGMLQTALEETISMPRKESDTQETENGGEANANGHTEQGPSSKDRNPTGDELAAIEPYPFFFNPSNLAGTLHCATPPEAAVRGALIGLGYQTTRSHCKPGSIKTDAPWSVIWRVMKEWARQKAPVKKENFKPGSPGYQLFGFGKENAGVEAEPSEKKAEGEEKEPEVVFDESLGRQRRKDEKLVRYQINPRENWGPMNKAKDKS